jgi:hypothetical protein
MTKNGIKSIGELMRERERRHAKRGCIRQIIELLDEGINEYVAVFGMDEDGLTAMIDEHPHLVDLITLRRDAREIERKLKAEAASAGK